MPLPAFLANHVATAGVGPAVQALRAGRPLLDVIEAAIRPVEVDPYVDSVGYGGAPNVLGEVECDAAIMLGATRQSGAVGALRGYRHPIAVARQVLEITPHVFLVGTGAERFAAEAGAEPRDMLSPAAAAEHAAWLARHGLSAGPGGGLEGPLAGWAWQAADDLHARGTTVVLVADAEGRLAGGTSTSGWAFKYPGRLGDTPVIGAGLYVDDRYGAAACTHNGEMAIRAGTARAVVAFLQHGATVAEACRLALDDLATLRGGYLGPVIIHALDPRGNACVMGGTPRSGHWIWDADMPVPELRMAGGTGP
jgi:L-asparaginase